MEPTDYSIISNQIGCGYCAHENTCKAYCYNYNYGAKKECENFEHFSNCLEPNKQIDTLKK
jgi:hypothetical protein